MRSDRRWVVAVALLAIGGIVGVGASHINLSWEQSAHAVAPAIAEAKPALPPPSQAQVDIARQFSRTFAQVAAQLSPSVVRISVTKTMKGVQMRGRGFPFGNPFEGTPFERFFGDRDDQQQGAVPKQHGMGSGVIIDGKGHILTNNHVVEGADEVKVSLSDGKTVTGRVVGTDPNSDLAVVKVDAVDAKPAKLGDSDKMLVGEWVMAIGNPFGLDHTVTVGVLSAKNRYGFESGHYEDFLQTDASINPGNSGGPLINLDGEVIGINTMIAGIGTGIGFAVPSSMAKPIAEQLIQNGKVRRAFLGVAMQPLTPELQKSLGNGAPTQGALVNEVKPGAPAERAGVKAGDIIVAVDGTKTDNSAAVQRTVFSKKIGQRIDLTVWRDGKLVHLNPVTGELPGDNAVASRQGPGEQAEPRRHAQTKLGLGLTSLTPDLAQRAGVEPNMKGAVVTAVRPGSPAQEAGLQEGDVLVEVDRKPVASAQDAERLLTAQRSGGHLVRVRRHDQAIFTVIPTA